MAFTNGTDAEKAMAPKGEKGSTNEEKTRKNLRWVPDELLIKAYKEADKRNEGLGYIADLVNQWGRKNNFLPDKGDEIDETNVSSKRNTIAAAYMKKYTEVRGMSKEEAKAEIRRLFPALARGREAAELVDLETLLAQADEFDMSGLELD